MTEQPAKKRRIRYRGTHPRRFAEKYKEHDPQRYAAEMQKVMARGQTPAGTHRPICVEQIVDLLQLEPGKVGLDATLGYGGHAEEILQRLVPGGHLFALDVDPLELPKTAKRLEALGYGPEVLSVQRMNFAGIGQLLTQCAAGFDFVLADLGVSSMQLDAPQRGFSYKQNGPLDLRFNPSKGRSAAQLLASIGEQELTTLLQCNADEPQAPTIAAALGAAARPCVTTADLVALITKTMERVRGAHTPGELKKTLQRCFQALRIAVNDEFGALDRFLCQLPLCLKAGGRVAILSFHSGEDRRVKKAFQSGLRRGMYSRVAPEPLRPSAPEQRSNPRSACAKLRWAVRS